MPASDKKKKNVETWDKRVRRLAYSGLSTLGTKLPEKGGRGAGPHQRKRKYKSSTSLSDLSDRATPNAAGHLKTGKKRGGEDRGR